MPISIEDKASIVIEQILTRANNLAPLKIIVGLIMQTDVDLRYDSAPSGTAGGTVYGGVTWPALSDAYLAARPDRATGLIGLDTGESRQSFTVGNSSNILEGSKDRIVFGSSQPKVRGFNSKRKLIVYHPELDAQIQQAFINWVIEGIS